MPGQDQSLVRPDEQVIAPPWFFKVLLLSAFSSQLYDVLVVDVDWTTCLTSEQFAIQMYAGGSRFPCVFIFFCKACFQKDSIAVTVDQLEAQKWVQKGQIFLEGGRSITRLQPQLYLLFYMWST
jgi:hypothetical protein